MTKLIATVVIIITFLHSCDVLTRQKNSKSYCCDCVLDQLGIIRRDYEYNKDSTILINFMPVIDSAIYHCYPYINFLDGKIWVLRKLGRYSEAITYLKETEYPYISCPFGVNYVIMDLEYMQYEEQGDTVKSEQVYSKLIEFMEFSFFLYNKVNNEAEEDEIEADSISKQIELYNSIPLVNPYSWSALICYYPIRILRDPKEQLIQEIEQIKIIDDTPDELLKRDLIEWIKTTNQKNN